MPGAELVDPIPYAGWWPWVALGIVLVVVAWYVWVVRSTRAPAQAPPATLPATQTNRPHARAQSDPYAALRGTTLARLDEVERRYRAQEIDVRGVNLEMRWALREFATGRTGVDTTAMTAETARLDRRTRPLASLLENSSLPAFASTSRTRVGRTLDQARKLVRAW
ncbi:hypothetical protein [Cellulomonas fengjieae]|uniref:DUF4129 domain-containing protein n=1 Tax=Cellulomonas fengjieae TaxID=2819978 RepID=A0ABS3SLT7_9CELL|nr:hypothetical protein [Cellulomonas fengjieae]MBO3086329.1 hypothetical protein [Cellulomonas fengjieae]QVI65632.1 hypothetical protein KG102_16305 [Cellulomonas fengjieae]